jgi:hypothetical protein
MGKDGIDLTGARCPDCGGAEVALVGSSGIPRSRLHCDRCGRITGARPVWSFRDGPKIGNVWDRMQMSLIASLGCRRLDDLVVRSSTARAAGSVRIADAIEGCARWHGLVVKPRAGLRLPPAMVHSDHDCFVEHFLQIPGRDGGMVIDLATSPRRSAIDKLAFCRNELGLEALLVNWRAPIATPLPRWMRLIDLYEIERRLVAELDGRPGVS